MKMQEPLDTRRQSQIEGPALLMLDEGKELEGEEDEDLSDVDDDPSEESGSVTSQPREEKVFDETSGRVRRRAVFNDNLDDEVGDSEDDDEHFDGNDNLEDEGDNDIVLRSLTSNEVFFASSLDILDILIYIHFYDFNCF